jgi:uncharacterized protein (TIGR00251 family)
LINYSEKDGFLWFRVQVVPRASRSEIVGAYDETLRVRIAAPPVDGAANNELVRVIAKAFGVSRSAVEITAGLTAKRKELRIEGASPERLRALIKKK